MPSSAHLGSRLDGSRLDLLLRLVESITASPDLDHVLDRVVQSAVSLADDSHSSLWILQGSRLVKRAEAGRHLSAIPRRTELDIGEGVIGRAALQQQTLVVPDVQADVRHVCREYYRAEKLVASAATPLVSHGRLVGVLVLATRSADALGDGEIEMLTAFAGHAAIAIESGVARAQAQRSAESFRDLVDTLDAIVIEADAETFQITFVNHRAEAILGYPRHAWLTDPNFLVNHMHPDDRDRAVAHRMAATAKGRDHVMEYRMLAADGRVLWVHDLVRVPPAEAGGRRQLRSVIVDITARKQAELELQEQRQLLTHLTRVATLGELSGALAHEMNQPLTSILSNAQAALRLLERGTIDLAEFRDILRDIADEDRRAGEVIRRLRALLRRGETPRQPLDVNDVASDVLRLTHSELIGHGVTVSVQLAPGLPKVRGDRVALQQVLLNLVVNACDAMRQDQPLGRELTVATTQDGDGAVRVAIVDRGAGIAAEGIERVFEPFFTTKEHGLGLGLAICRSIVAAHGGRLGAANNADRGATFWFTLPPAP